LDFLNQLFTAGFLFVNYFYKLKGGEKYMKKILGSLAVIAIMAATTAGATAAYFHDEVTLDSATVATGTLNLNIVGDGNGDDIFVPASIEDLVPGNSKLSPDYVLKNEGTVPIKSLLLGVDYQSGDWGLWSNLKVKIQVWQGGTTHDVYSGLLSQLPDDRSLKYFGDLNVGQAEGFRYIVWLDESNGDQNLLMGKTLKWDFVIEARSN
jgi:predicted ribosomally synthesized peptide with SipW-like signal peptide